MRTGGGILGALLAVAGAVLPAQAQWVVTPYIGANTGDVETGKLFGGNGGGIGGSVVYFAGRVGFEFDIERHYHFFHDPDLGDTGPPSSGAGEDVKTRATSFMGNVIVPIRIKDAANWRLFGAAGLGLVRASFVHEGPNPDPSQNDCAFNAGGGVMYRLTSLVGLRGDPRYFRVLADEDKSVPPGQLGDLFGVYRNYGFVRFTFGVTVGFPR